VNSVTPDPWWNLQPELLHVGDPTRPAVQIPPGPNNAVGDVWIDLSKEHYGIHGTARPETIGYATSSGCVRLTNWDANFLGDKVEAGIPVRFIDIPPSRQDHPSHGAG
jgi:lipoprotein-anchoring transpeptidase ErfK/SrfK